MARALSAVSATRKRPVGILCRSMNCLAKTLLPSSSAALRLGPKTRSPRFSNSSTMPRDSGISGPTTVRSMPVWRAKSDSCSMFESGMATFSATSRVPPLPGAQ